jgi:hypothetical protein
MESCSAGNIWRRQGAWAQMHLPCQVHELHHTSPQLTSAITSTFNNLPILQDGALHRISEAHCMMLNHFQSAQNSAGIQTLLDVRTTAHYDLHPAHTVPRPSGMHRRLSSKVFWSYILRSRISANMLPARECTNPPKLPAEMLI